MHLTGLRRTALFVGPILFAFACPTRTVYYPDGGSSGSAGVAGSSAAAANGGTAGIGGDSVDGGRAGAAQYGGMGGPSAATGGVLGAPGGSGGTQAGRGGSQPMGGSAAAGSGDSGGRAGAIGTSAGGMSGASGMIGGAGVSGTGDTAGTGGSIIGTGGNGCQASCGSTQVCLGGLCRTKDGYACTQDGDCLGPGGACVIAYVDLDGDGYGTGQPAKVCTHMVGSIWPAPPGYALANGDCCDDPNHVDTSKLIHPNAAFQTVSAGGLCGLTWDYDCSGTIEKSNIPGGCSASAQYPNCSSDETPYPELACGTNVMRCYCVTAGGSFGSPLQCVSGNCDAPQLLGCK